MARHGEQRAPTHGHQGSQWHLAEGDPCKVALPRIRHRRFNLRRRRLLVLRLRPRSTHFSFCRSFTDDDMEEMSSEQLLALIDNIKTPLHAEEPSSLPQGAQWKDCLKVCTDVEPSDRSGVRSCANPPLSNCLRSSIPSRRLLNRQLGTGSNAAHPCRSAPPVPRLCALKPINRLLVLRLC